MNDIVERLRAPAYWFSGSADGHEGENDTPYEAADAIEALRERVRHLEKTAAAWEAGAEVEAKAHWALRDKILAILNANDVPPAESLQARVRNAIAQRDEALSQLRALKERVEHQEGNTGVTPTGTPPVFVNSREESDRKWRDFMSLFWSDDKSD